MVSTCKTYRPLKDLSQASEGPTLYVQRPFLPSDCLQTGRVRSMVAHRVTCKENDRDWSLAGLLGLNLGTTARAAMHVELHMVSRAELTALPGTTTFVLCLPESFPWQHAFVRAAGTDFRIRCIRNKSAKWTGRFKSRRRRQLGGSAALMSVPQPIPVGVGSRLRLPALRPRGHHSDVKCKQGPMPQGAIREKPEPCQSTRM